MHSRALDGLRGLSAQVVFVSHLVAFLTPLPSAIAQHALGWSARAAVIVFFCLSGFVITSSIVRSTRAGSFDLLRYAVRRSARIYPPYLLTIALCWIVWLLLSKPSLPSLPSAIAELARAMAFFFLNRDVVTQIDGPLWSLRLEVICYVVAGLGAYWATHKANAPVWSGLALGLGLVVAVATPFVFTFGLSAFAWFGLGALASTGYLKALVPFSLAGAAALFLAGIPLTSDGPLAIGATDMVGAMIYQFVFAAFLAAYLVELSGADRGHPLGRLERLGGFSYTLYLVHMPLVLFAVSMADRLQILGPGRIGIAVVVLLAVELLSWLAARIVERPAEFGGAMLRRLERFGWVEPERKAT